MPFMHSPEGVITRTNIDEDSMKPSYPSPVPLSIRAILAATLALGAGLNSGAIAQSLPPSDGALRAFEIVRMVLQHPRCQNCHIPGDAPLQGDEGHPHNQNVV